MTLARRIIPCLDTDGARVVKGVNFVNLRDAGDPAELAARYNKEGADELVVLDIAASRDHRPTFLETIRRVAAQLAIPLTAGGGVANVDEGRAILRAGADKLTVNTAALKRPELLTELAAEFGSQAVVLAIDAKRVGNRWEAFVRGGHDPTGCDAVAWAKEGASRGAGEILLTSMDRDGTRSGFDLALTCAVSTAVGVPVIASGGADAPDTFLDVFVEGRADAALAASIFHDSIQGLRELKHFLAGKGVPVRLTSWSSLASTCKMDAPCNSCKAESGAWRLMMCSGCSSASANTRSCTLSISMPPWGREATRGWCASFASGRRCACELAAGFAPRPGPLASSMLAPKRSSWAARRFEAAR
jgi:cyclase